MKNKHSRTQLLLGEENIKKIAKSHVAIFGIGGVGGYALEGLVRCGIGAVDIIDSDTVDITNLNRQIIATEQNIGLSKVEVAKERINAINSELKVNCHNIFFNPDTIGNFEFKKYDYIIDAIDTVSSKILLITKAIENNVPIISCMGTGNKLNPADLQVSDIYKTSVCPLARVMRYELKKRGIKKLKVVYSKETPIKPAVNIEEKGRHIPASAVFVPASAGMLIASEVIKDLLSIDNAD